MFYFLLKPKEPLLLVVGYMRANLKPLTPQNTFGARKNPSAKCPRKKVTEIKYKKGKSITQIIPEGNKL